MFKWIKPVVTTLLLSHSFLADALTVVIEPNDFIIGQDISESSYATLLYADYSSNYSPIRATQSQWDFPATGNLTFGNYGMSCIRENCGIGDYQGFGIFFKQEVSRIWVTALNWGYPFPLHTNWAAFDTTGTRIAIGQSTTAARGESVLIDIQAQGIAGIFIGGGGDTNAIEFDRLIFEIPDVPLPPAAWLFMSGLLGLVCTARRKSVSA